jgi:hypothetical protein
MTRPRNLISLFHLQPDLNKAADAIRANSAEPDSLETTEYPRLREFEKILLTPHDLSQKDHPKPSMHFHGQRPPVTIRHCPPKRGGYLAGVLSGSQQVVKFFLLVGSPWPQRRC